MPTGKPYKPNEADRLKLAHGFEFGLSLMFIAEAMGLAVNTLKKHYRDVIEAAELRGGNSFRPTKHQRGLVKLAAALGQPHEDIAQMLGISRNTLEKHLGEELRLGALHAKLKVGSNLFKIATADPPLPGTVSAAIFWAKTRMGWRCAPAVAQASTYGSKSEVQIVIVAQDQDRCDGSAPPSSDSEYGLPPDVEPTPTGVKHYEEVLDIELYRANASYWQEVATGASDMTLHAAFTGVACAFERLAFVATQPAKAAMTRPERKIRARRRMSTAPPH
jgi:hypothetical protein